MSSISKFPLDKFDSNVCLNCSVKFTNDGEVETQKIHFLEVLDEDHESVSVFAALNSAFKIPMNRQIEGEEGIAFGCCPACSTLLGNLYELQRELDMLRNMDSVVSKIVEMGHADAKQLESEPCIMDTEDTEDENSEIAEDPLQLSPEEVEIRPDDSAIEPNTKTTSTASGQGQPEPIPVPIPVPLQILAQYFATTTLRCLNCCVEIEYSTTGSYRNPLAKPAVGAVMGNGAPVKIQIADILNHILKLPLQNNLTADLKMCVDCAKMLLNVHVCYCILESVANPGSHLNFIYQQMRSFIVSGFIQNSYGFSNTVPLHVANVSGPSPQTTRVTQSSNETDAGNTGQERQPESMDMDTGSDSGSYSDSDAVPAPGPVRKYTSLSGLSVAERRARRNDERREKRRTLPFITFDPCPHCGVVLRTKETTALRDHIKRQHERVPTEACGICGRPFFTLKQKEKHEQWSHLSAAEKLELRSQDPSCVRTRPVSEARPKKKYVMSAEREARYKKDRHEWNKNRPVITHDPCPHCGVVLRCKYKNALKFHIKLRHNFISPFTCDICGRPCQSSVHKQNHQKIHLGSDERAQLRELDPTPRTWPCPECGKTLTAENTLKSHLKTVHADIETRRIRCQEVNCDYTSLNKMTFKRHMKRVHDPTFKPKHRCKICDQSFRLYNELKEHEMTACEASSRPFPCDQGTCSRRFKLKHALMLHLHSVHPLTPEEARRKLYPDLECPDWVYKKRSRLDRKQGPEKKTPKKQSPKKKSPKKKKK